MPFRPHDQRLLRRGFQSHVESSELECTTALNQLLKDKAVKMHVHMDATRSKGHHKDATRGSWPY